MGVRPDNYHAPHKYICDAESDLATIENPKQGQQALALSEGTYWFHTGTAWQEISDTSGHVAASDPHTGYRLESADHSHATTGLQGGQISHDSALTGVSANDHHNQAHTDSDHSDGANVKAASLFTVRRTTDSAAKTDNTIASDTQLLWAVASGQIWAVEGFLIVSSANVTHDFKMGWSVPAGTTIQWGALSSIDVANTSWSIMAVTATPNPLRSESQAIDTGSRAGIHGVSLAGIVVAGGTAGNVVLQWAQNTTDAGELKLLTNSFLRLTRLA